MTEVSDPAASRIRSKRFAFQRLGQVSNVIGTWSMATKKLPRWLSDSFTPKHTVCRKRLVMVEDRSEDQVVDLVVVRSDLVVLTLVQVGLDALDLV